MSRQRQKVTATMLGMGIAFAGFTALGVPMQSNFTDPGALIAGLAIIAIAMFVGK